MVNGRTVPSVLLFCALGYALKLPGFNKIPQKHSDGRLNSNLKMPALGKRCHKKSDLDSHSFKSALLNKRLREHSNAKPAFPPEDSWMKIGEGFRKKVEEWEYKCKYVYGEFDPALESKYQQEINKETPGYVLPSRQLSVLDCIREMRVCLERIKEPTVNDPTTVLNEVKRDSAIVTETSPETSNSVDAHNGFKSNLNVTYVISKESDEDSVIGSEENVLSSNNTLKDVINIDKTSNTVAIVEGSDKENKNNNLEISVQNCDVSKNVINEFETSRNNVLMSSTENKNSNVVILVSDQPPASNSVMNEQETTMVTSSNNNIEISVNDKSTLDSVMKKCETERMATLNDNIRVSISDQQASVNVMKECELERIVTPIKNVVKGENIKTDVSLKNLKVSECVTNDSEVLASMVHNEYNIENKNYADEILVNSHKGSEKKCKKVGSLAPCNNNKNVKMASQNKVSPEQHVVLEVFQIGRKLLNNSQNMSKETNQFLHDSGEPTATAYIYRDKKSKENKVFTELGKNSIQNDEVIKMNSARVKTSGNSKWKLYHKSKSVVEEYNKFTEVQNSSGPAKFNRSDSCKCRLYRDLQKDNELIGSVKNNERVRDKSNECESKKNMLNYEQEETKDYNSDSWSTNETRNMMCAVMQNSKAHKKGNIVDPKYQVEGIFRLSDFDSQTDIPTGGKSHVLSPKNNFDSFTDCDVLPKSNMHNDKEILLKATNSKEILLKATNSVLEKSKINSKRHVVDNSIPNQLISEKIECKESQTVQKSNNENEHLSKASLSTLANSRISKTRGHNVSDNICPEKIQSGTLQMISKTNSKDVQSGSSQTVSESDIYNKKGQFSKVPHSTLKDSEINKTGEPCDSDGAHPRKIQSGISQKVLKGGAYNKRQLLEVSHSILEEDSARRTAEHVTFDNSDSDEQHPENMQRLNSRAISIVHNKKGQFSEISYSVSSENETSNKICHITASTSIPKEMLPEKIQHNTLLYSKSNVLNENEVNDNNKSAKNIFDSRNKKINENVPKKDFYSEPVLNNRISLKSLSSFEVQKIKELKRNIKKSVKTGKFTWTYGNKIYYFTKETANGKVVVDCKC